VKNSTSRLVRANRSLPAIVAIGSSLAALPAAALELGELTVHSGLGQPLRASIAYVLAPNEQLASNCVTLRRGRSASGMPNLGAATISVAKGVISLTGRTPVLEPMAAAHIVVNCPFTPKISREYLTFVDPAEVVDYQQAEVLQPSIPVANPVANTNAVQATAAAIISPVQQNLGVSTQYLVQVGDTISSIVLRISDRSVGLWPAVNAIVDANPDAFVNNDPNQLTAGSWINIPAFDGSRSVVADVQPSVVEPFVVQSSVVEPPVVESTLVEATVVEATVVEESIVDAAIVDTQASTENAQVYQPQAAADGGVTTGDLLPGDIVLDAPIERPAATSAPVISNVIITPTADANGGGNAPNWLVWLAGGAIASILGLVMFRRRFRGDNAPVEPAANLPNRPRYEDSQTEDTASVESLGMDLDLTDESPTEENLALDADLISGTGLNDSSSADISQDFGFAATTELDIELPFEKIAPQSDTTDIMPPMRVDAESILDDEVMPAEEDDYDMSVIVDATKIPQPEDVTERDLKAVEVAIDDETMIAENYSINKEVDFETIEQDYEDEMTATQALNEEIARAATNLALGLEDNGDNDATARSPALTSVEELEVTAQMPAQNDDHSNLEETGINEAITVVAPADEETVEMPVKSGKSS
jgi:hypothetical protein